MLEQSKITQIDQARLVAGSGRAAADRGTSTVLDTPTADDPNQAASMRSASIPSTSPISIPTCPSATQAPRIAATHLHLKNSRSLLRPE